MANENVKKIYEELVTVTEELRNANLAGDQDGIRRAEHKMLDILPILHHEKEYEGWAESLLEAIKGNMKGKYDAHYVIRYAELLCELIGINLKQDKADKIDDIKENAKATCANIINNVQARAKTAQAVIKEEAPKYTAMAKDVKDAVMRKGPKYAAEATRVFKNVSQKFEDTINSLMDEDEDNGDKD